MSVEGMLFLLYMMYPWWKICSLVYLLGAVSPSFLYFPFALHTAVLLARSYFLDRLPVTNMQETFIYVPWVVVLLSLFFKKRLKSSYPFVSLSAALLLFLPFILGLGEDITPLKASLNSSFWLFVHVLVICSSYGFFVLSSLISHLYLFKRNPSFPFVIIKLLYLGSACLVVGTLLGGAWASSAWGRWWGWDPKEMWALVTGSFYLFVIHLHRLRRISFLHLAFAASFGLLITSFCWYGVNCLITTGLHSYGFNLTNPLPYYIFLATDAALLLYLYMKSLVDRFISF